MDYPYQLEFTRYCKYQKHYADGTRLIMHKSLTNFWRYYQANSSTEANINAVRDTDIQTFLDGLETKLKLRKNTINKYISHLKCYFAFLYTHHLIDYYPVLEINGRKFNRKRVFVINWMPYLPQIAQIPGIHAVTVKMMCGIALGYLPKEVLKLRYAETMQQIKSASLRQYLQKHVDFKQQANPYLLAAKKGGCYSSDFHLCQEARADRSKLGMSLTLQYLRLSYVYSILNQKTFNDFQLEQKLRCNDKTLLYYRSNMFMYNTLRPFSLPKPNSKQKQS